MLLFLDLLICLRWLTCYYMKKTFERVKMLKQNGSNDFVAKNDSQLFYARNLTLVYGEVIHKFNSHYYKNLMHN